jgi:hypothetical protein
MASVSALTGIDSPVLALAIHPITPSTLYVGTNGGGVFRSTTSGASWTAVNNGLTDVGVQAVAIDPRTPSTLYAWSLAMGGNAVVTITGCRFTGNGA